MEHLEPTREIVCSLIRLSVPMTRFDTLEIHGERADPAPSAPPPLEAGAAHVCKKVCHKKP